MKLKDYVIRLKTLRIIMLPVQNLYLRNKMQKKNLTISTKF